MTCNYKDCNRRRFMDTDRCFDHQFTPTDKQRRQIRALVAGWAVFYLGLILFLVWVVYELVTWVISK